MAKKKIKNCQKYKFKKGQELHLDVIYAVQGLCGGDWWESHVEVGKPPKNGKAEEDLIISRDIQFEIIEYDVNT